MNYPYIKRKLFVAVYKTYLIQFYDGKTTFTDEVIYLNETLSNKELLIELNNFSKLNQWTFCLILAPGVAVYFDPNSDYIISESLPSGGVEIKEDV